MRRMLRVPAVPTIGEEQAHGIFTLSILISATRCLLTYVVFPIVAPALEAATGAGPAIGIPIGVVALVFDVIGIRRFWLANHRYRWMVSVIYLIVIALVSTLLVRDIVGLA
jgi:hypothetical protein